MTKWFDEELEKHLNGLLNGRISMNQFRCFFFPNTWFLNLPPDHRAYGIRDALNERTPKTDEEAIKVIKSLL